MNTSPTVLVTGGLGFIGLHVAQRLVQSAARVVLMDNLSPQIHGAIPHMSCSLLESASVQALRGDVTSRRDWKAALQGADCVVHLAAETGTAQSMYEIDRYAQTNVGGTAILLDLLANEQHKISKVVLASSRSVYGEGAYQCHRCGTVYPGMRTGEQLRQRQWDPVCPNCRAPVQAVGTPEKARTAPASIYAATKLAQEELVRITCEALGIPNVTFRLQNVYGEGQSLRNPYTGILSIFSNRIRQKKPIHLFEDGLESRDFVHVSDVAEAFVLGVMTDRGNGRTLNVGSGRPTSVKDVAMILKSLLKDSSEPIITGEYRVGDIRHCYADLTEISSILGFTARQTIENGLESFMSWVLTQPVEHDKLDLANDQLILRGLLVHASSLC